MAAYPLSITDDDVTKALRLLLLSMLPAGVEVAQGQVNRVAAPQSENYIVFWPITRARTSTNVDTSDGLTETVTIQRGTTLHYQIDLHGPNGADYGQVITTLWRDEYSTSTAIFSPLYASDGHQSPFVNGQMQYEDKWMITLALQVHPSVTLPQQSATALEIDLIPVDV